MPNNLPSRERWSENATTALSRSRSSFPEGDGKEKQRCKQLWLARTEATRHFHPILPPEESTSPFDFTLRGAAGQRGSHCCRCNQSWGEEEEEDESGVHGEALSPSHQVRRTCGQLGHRKQTGNERQNPGELQGFPLSWKKNKKHVGKPVTVAATNSHLMWNWSEEKGQKGN